MFLFAPNTYLQNPGKWPVLLHWLGAELWGGLHQPFSISRFSDPDSDLTYTDFCLAVSSPPLLLFLGLFLTPGLGGCKMLASQNGWGWHLLYASVDAHTKCKAMGTHAIDFSGVTLD